jgi:hypothetical protein
VPKSRRELAALLRALRSDSCPFTDLPSGKSLWGGGVTADQMHEMRWTSPKTVVHIKFTKVDR